MPKDLYVSSLLDVYGYSLNEKQRSVLRCYYDEDLSLSEIAENEGITRQGVADLIKRSEAQLRMLEENCHYCEKFIKLKELSTSAQNGDTESVKKIFEVIESL
ncbi:MAG: sigma factor-like helix-turn-helix DNA-binding protein [Oscillospiraceae bacterium]|nr:sigma factor-like helix-turn-helix DNA-binding protein [Oscillospiraceae bacterium]